MRERPLGQEVKGLDFLCLNLSGENLIMANQPPSRVAQMSSQTIYFLGTSCPLYAFFPYKGVKKALNEEKVANGV